jgi:hypothetical protein
MAAKATALQCGDPVSVLSSREWAARSPQLNVMELLTT